MHHRHIALLDDLDLRDPPGAEQRIGRDRGIAETRSQNGLEVEVAGELFVYTVRCIEAVDEPIARRRASRSIPMAPPSATAGRRRRRLSGSSVPSHW